MNQTDQVIQLEARVKMLTTLLQLGLESVDKQELPDLFLHIVNNSRLLSRYDRCSLASAQDGRVRLLAQSGQPEAKQDTEHGRQLVTLLGGFQNLEKPAQLSGKTIAQLSEDDRVVQAFETLNKNGTTFILPLPLTTGPKGSGFLWCVEFFDVFDPGEEQILPLLSKFYGMALSGRAVNRSGWSAFRFSPSLLFKRVFAAVLLIAFGLILFLVDVNQTVIADCELVPNRVHPSYAPYSGVIEQVHYNNGEQVRPGDVVMAYDTEEMLFQLAEAVRNREEIAAELDLARQQSFSSFDLLGRVKLLELRLEKSSIDIERNRWYLDRSGIGAGMEGRLILENPERWRGKAIQAGEPLFEVVDTETLRVKIELHEADGGILRDISQECFIFLHARPEKKISANLVSQSPKPRLTEHGTYAYILEATFDKQPETVNGMRGVARLRGGELKLVNYLFRNVLLWWRQV